MIEGFLLENPFFEGKGVPKSNLAEFCSTKIKVIFFERELSLLLQEII